MTGRSIALFIAAAIAEIGGAYLVWLGIKDHNSWLGWRAATSASPASP